MNIIKYQKVYAAFVVFCATNIANYALAAERAPSPPTQLEVRSSQAGPPSFHLGDDSLMVGMTPGKYKLPVGWTLVVTQDMEGSCPANQICGGNHGMITTAKPHSGSKSIEGIYDSDQSNVRWALREGNIGSYTEVYLSYYEWVDAGAKFNDEYWMAQFNVTNPFAEVIVQGGYWSPGFNKTTSNFYTTCQGTSGDCPALFMKTADPADGAWVQWEIWFRPNRSGSSDGFLRMYKNGVRWGNPIENVVLNATRSFNNSHVQAGGVYTKLVWMTDYPNCSVPSGCSSEPGVGSDFCTSLKGWSGQPFSNPICNPIDPPLSSFKRYIDDVIVMKR